MLVIFIIVFAVLLMLLAVTIYCLYLNLKKHDAKRQEAKKGDDRKDENKKTRKESVAEKKEREVKRKYSAVVVEDDLTGIIPSALEDDNSGDIISIAEGILNTTD